MSVVNYDGNWWHIKHYCILFELLLNNTVYRLATVINMINSNLVDLVMQSSNLQQGFIAAVIKECCVEGNIGGCKLYQINYKNTLILVTWTLTNLNTYNVII